MNLPRSIAFLVLTGILTLAAGSPSAQQTTGIEVTFTGLDTPLQQNVRAQLCLLRQQSASLTENMVIRCYDQAEEEIRRALEPFGYYSPAIEKTLIREKPLWKVRFNIVPGEPVRVVELDIQLEGPGEDDPALVGALSLFPLRQNSVLNHQLYEQGKKELSANAIAEGYRDAVFSRNVVQVDRQKRLAWVRLTLATGPRYFFGTTTFAADFLSERLLQRMLPYAVGDPYSPRKIIQLRQGLFNSDYFSTVEVQTGETPPGTMNIPVSVSLSPRNPNKYGLGAGYGTDTGFRGSLEWTNRLLNRYGHQFNLQLQPAERKNYVGMAYTIPIYDPRTDRLTLVGKWEKEDYDNTTSEARNISLSYDHIRENGDYSVYLEFLDEDYEIGLESGHATLLKPGIRSTWRRADDRLKTKNGIRVTADLTGANENVVSDATFLQGSLSAKAILSFFEQWRAIGRFHLGATLIDSLSDLPPSLRYYAGGDQSVRGYAYKSIGPTDAAGNVVGAKHLVVYSLELERTLFANWSAALFFDSGDAPDELIDLSMKNGIGVGIRWNAPFGQVRLDVADAVSEGESSWRIHFTVGADL